MGIGLLALFATARLAAAHPEIADEIVTLDARIATHPTASDLLRRGELHRLAGAWSLAGADYDRAAALDTASIAPAIGRAWLELDQGMAWQAEGSLDAVIAAHPAEPHALELRARARAAQARWSDAAADLERLAALATPSPDQILSRAEWLDRAGEPDAAVRALDDGIARLGAVPALELAAAERLDRLGRTANAARHRAAWSDAIARARSDAPPARPITAPAAREEAALAAIGDPPDPGGGGQALTVTRGPYLMCVSSTSAVVRWRTAAPGASWVRYGEGVALTQLAGDTTYTTEHRVTLAALQPATRYAYQIVSPAAAPARTPQSSFRTAALADSGAATRVWVIGDGGSGDANAAAVRDAFQRWAGPRDPDVWLMLGDNAYESGTDAEYQAGVFDMYADLLKRVPLFPTRGNHDILYAGSGNDYYDVFSMPSAGECGGVPSGTPAYYAFNEGDVHFICLDSEGSDRTRGGAMLRWLESDLAANHRTWTIAFWHHPPYSKGSHDSDNVSDSDGKMTDMRQNALGLLDSAGVDLVLTGHSHSYERSFLLRSHYGFSWTLTSAMKVDSLNGRSGGNGPYRKPTLVHGPLEGIVYAVAGCASELAPGPLNHPVMVSSIETLGSLVLDIAGKRLDARFLNAAGAVRDSFTILKGTGLAARLPDAAPAALALEALEPDPMSGEGHFRFTLPRPGPVSLAVIDAAGRRIRTLTRSGAPAGRHEVVWDGRDARGPVPAGVYFAVLRAGGEQRVERFVVMR